MAPQLAGAGECALRCALPMVGDHLQSNPTIPGAGELFPVAEHSGPLACAKRALRGTNLGTGFLLSETYPITKTDHEAIRG